jgi:hypothetical protein
MRRAFSPALLPDKMPACFTGQGMTATSWRALREAKVGPHNTASTLPRTRKERAVGVVGFAWDLLIARAIGNPSKASP